MTTRIFAATARSIGTLTCGKISSTVSRYRPDYENEVDRRRMLSAWPNPGGAQSGYLMSKSTAGACSSTAALACSQAPGARGLAPRRRDLPDALHLDHWGDRPGSGQHRSGRRASYRRRSSGSLRAGGRLRGSASGSASRTCSRTPSASRSTGGGGVFETAGMSVTARRVLADLLAFGFRVSCNGKTVAYSGDSGPSDELTELRATPTSFSARRRCWSRIPRRGREAISRRTRRKRPSRPPAPTAPSPTAPRSARSPEFEQVHDGQEIDGLAARRADGVRPLEVG